MNEQLSQTQLDRTLAKPMFILTLLWLAVAGVALHLLQDEKGRYIDGAIGCGSVLIFLWSAFIVEYVLHLKSVDTQRHTRGMACLFPPIRIGGRDHVSGSTVWIPGMGWQKASDELAAELEYKLGYPMIAIALLVLPLLAVELYFDKQIAAIRSFGLVVQLAQAFIWFAFAAEYILKISLVTKKFDFAKRHWLDLLIICLPMIAFMRIFRLGSTARLTRLTKSARIFRLRGLAMRAWRAVLILEIVDRILHRDAHKRLRLLEEQVREKREEIGALEAEITAIEQQLAVEGKTVDTPSTG